MSNDQPFDFRAYVKKHANDSVEELMQDMFGDGPDSYCRHFDVCVQLGEKTLRKIFSDTELAVIVMQATSSIVGDMMYRDMGNLNLNLPTMLQMGSSREFRAMAMMLFLYIIGLSNKEELY